MMDSRIPGIDNKCRVSLTAFQSSSEIRTAFAFFPEISIGSWLSAVSLINLHSVFRASLTVIEFNTLLLRDASRPVNARTPKARGGLSPEQVNFIKPYKITSKRVSLNAYYLSLAVC